MLDFETGSGVSAAEAEVFPSVLEVELKKTGAFDLIEAGQREQILGQQAASLSGCTDDECAIEIGRLLTADRIVLGKLSKAGGEYILLAKIVNVGDGRVMTAETLRSGSIGGLLDLMSVLAGKLAGTGSSGGEGRIVYESGPAAPSSGGAAQAAGRAMIYFKSDVEGLTFTVKNLSGEVLFTGSPPKALTLSFADYTVEARDSRGLYYPFEDTLTVNRPGRAEYTMELLPMFGYLSRTTVPPGMTGRYDWLYLGTTPLSAYRLKSGSYSLSVRDPAGLHAPASREITIKDGLTERVSLTMEDSSVTVRVRETAGLSGKVFIDGEEAGRLPFSKRMPFRDFTLRVVPDSEAYKPYEETVVTRRAGETIRRDITLEGRFGWVSVETDPFTEGIIYVDGKSAGGAPNLLTLLAGEHTIRVEAEVEGAAMTGEETIRVREGMDAAVVVKLRGAGGGTTTAAAAPTEAPADLKIGDRYAGGIVFYLDGNGGGLVCAEEDQGIDIQWGGFGTTVGGTSMAVGTGAANTAAIVSKLGSGTYAAKLCADLQLNGYDDWFLPSKAELNLMYENLHKKGLGAFGSGCYWSSSEYHSSYAWGQNFNNGYQSYYHKYFVSRVRAVRAFTY